MDFENLPKLDLGMDWYFLALIGSNIISLTGMVLLKHATRQQIGLFSVEVIGSIFLYGCAFILYFFCLRKIQLNFAQPFSAALTVGGVVFLGWFLFGEKVTQLGVVGLILILSGIVLINV